MHDVKISVLSMLNCCMLGAGSCNWACRDTGICLSDSRRCNSQVDCNDGSDELDCRKSCTCTYNIARQLCLPKRNVLCSSDCYFYNIIRNTEVCNKSF